MNNVMKGGVLNDGQKIQRNEPTNHCKIIDVPR